MAWWFRCQADYDIYMGFFCTCFVACQLWWGFSFFPLAPFMHASWYLSLSCCPAMPVCYTCKKDYFPLSSLTSCGSPFDFLLFFMAIALRFWQERILMNAEKRRNFALCLQGCQPSRWYNPGAFHLVQKQSCTTHPVVTLTFLSTSGNHQGLYLYMFSYSRNLV